MLDNSVSYFLSNYWRNTPLYAEKIIPLLDTCLSSNFVLSDKVADAFYELTNKYKNTAELPTEMLKEFIREQGYGYILDLVVQDKDTIKLLWYLLVLIHQLKGSKEGLLLVLSLFEDNFDPSKTTIKQWYETIPVGRPNTFTLETAINIAKLGDGFFKRFETFLANYVYPELTAMKVNYNVDGRITYRPYARITINCDASIEIRDGYNGGPAKENLTRDLYNGGTAQSEYNGDYSRNLPDIENPSIYHNYTYLTAVVITSVYDSNTGKLIRFDVTGEEIPCDILSGGNAV